MPKSIRLVATNYPTLLSLGWSILFKKESTNNEIVVCTTIPHVNLRPIPIKDERYDYLSVLKGNCDKLKSDKIAYMDNVKRCLVNLKSTNAVKEQFPKALEYLGEKPNDNTEGAWGELRKKIQKAKTEK